MTETMMERADREYGQAGGVRPDGYSFIPKTELSSNPREIINERTRMWAADGMTFFRLTEVDEGMWLEVWKTQPTKQAPFDPPMTLTAPNQP